MENSFRASITLFTTEKGGRKDPIFSGYRPTLNFLTENNYSGVLELVDTEKLQPGESSFVDIRLLNSKVQGALRPQVFFNLVEGRRIIGSGRIQY